VEETIQAFLTSHWLQNKLIFWYACAWFEFWPSYCSLSVCSFSDKCYGSIFEVAQKHVLSNDETSKQSICRLKQPNRQVTCAVNKKIQASVS